MTTELDIDYRLRPSMSIERKMMVKILQRLQHIENLQDYQYIGFGSAYFSDFKMFHRNLGINNMINIEMETDAEPRICWNEPFDCIDSYFDRSDDVLPDLDLSLPTIMWLDYTTELKPYMFDDIQQFCYSSPPGSVLFITLNVDTMGADTLDESRYDTRHEKLEEDIGLDNIPTKAKEVELRDDWGLAKAYRHIILEKIKTDFLIPRNDARENDIQFKQLAFFTYEDGAPMMTLGGILYSHEILRGYKRASYPDLDVTRMGDEHYNINPPKLTFAEMRELEKRLPSSPTESEVPVTEFEKKQYAEIYKYFPRFVESRL